MTSGPVGRAGLVAVLPVAALVLIAGCGLRPSVVRSGSEPIGTPSITPSVSAPVSVEPTPAVSPSPSISPTPTLEASPTPTPTPTMQPAPTRSPTPTALPPSPTITSRPTTSAAPTKAPHKPLLPPDPAKTLPRAAPGSRGVVYLTFDDGPSVYTASYLTILTAHHATATFFQLGRNVADFPTLPAAIHRQGSSIGNHTYDHRDLTLLTKAEQRAEWRGGPQTVCGRSPYGATNAKVERVMRKLGLREVLWSVDTVDWSRPGAEIIYRRGAGAAVHNGSIVLMHDGGGDRRQSVQALPRILSELHRRGFLIRKLPGC